MPHPKRLWQGQTCPNIQPVWKSNMAVIFRHARTPQGFRPRLAVHFDECRYFCTYHVYEVNTFDVVIKFGRQVPHSPRLYCIPIKSPGLQSAFNQNTNRLLVMSSKCPSGEGVSNTCSATRNVRGVR